MQQKPAAALSFYKEVFRKQFIFGCGKAAPKAGLRAFRGLAGEKFSPRKASAARLLLYNKARRQYFREPHFLNADPEGRRKQDNMKKAFRFVFSFLSKKSLETAPACLCARPATRRASPDCLCARPAGSRSAPANELCPAPPQRRRGELDSLWFARMFVFALFFSGSLLVFGNLFAGGAFLGTFSAPSFKSFRAEPLQSSPAVLPKKPQQPAALSFPPFPVNLKTGSGSALAFVKIDLTTDRPAAKKEILLKNKKFKKHLLLLLSGRERGDLTKNKARFEEEIRSQFNIFLSQGSVEEVSFQTTFIN